MIKLIPIALCAALVVTACAPKGGGLPTATLDAAIGSSIGDPTTCVLIADRPTGKVLYTYGANFNCVRALPACDRPGTLSAGQALGLAAAGRGASCASNPDATRSVGWAEGVITGSTPPMIYSAVMEGQTALPGIEMNARLAQVFSNTGLSH